MTRTKAGFIVAALFLISTGCDKKDDGGANGAASATPAPSAAPAAKAATPATADDPVVCCKFGGVKGSSTKKLCEDGKGTVVPDGECPTLKK